MHSAIAAGCMGCWSFARKGGDWVNSGSVGRQAHKLQVTAVAPAIVSVKDPFLKNKGFAVRKSVEEKLDEDWVCSAVQ